MILKTSIYTTQPFQGCHVESSRAHKHPFYTKVDKLLLDGQNGQNPSGNLGQYRKAMMTINNSDHAR